MYEIIIPDSCLKKVKKFFIKHPELKPSFQSILEKITEDPLRPSLKLHPLQGSLQGIWSVRLNYQYRILLTLKIEEKQVILLNIGSHDDVY